MSAGSCSAARRGRLLWALMTRTGIGCRALTVGMARSAPVVSCQAVSTGLAAARPFNFHSCANCLRQRDLPCKRPTAPACANRVRPCPAPCAPAGTVPACSEPGVENSVKWWETDETARASEGPGVRKLARPSAEHVAMAVAALWLLLFGMLDATSGVIVISLFIVAPLIVATAADERRTAIFAGITVALTTGAGWWHGLIENSTTGSGSRRSAP